MRRVFLDFRRGIFNHLVEVGSICGKTHGRRRGPAFASCSGMFHDTAGHEQLTEQIIGCAIRVHEALGPGLFESIYKPCLAIELRASGLEADTARRVSVTYRGHAIGAEFCPDIIVNNIVVVELKAVEALARVHQTQVITYLKLTSLPVGLLINFNVDQLIHGVRRVVRPDLYVKKP
jgi:GxxExxY protein